MSGITIHQYIDQLEKWNTEIKKKTKILTLGYRVYKVLQFFQLASITVAASIITFLSALAIGLEDAQTTIIINSIILCFSIWIIFWNSAENVFHFGSTASSAVTSAKQYTQLYHELEVEIASAVNLGTDIISYDLYKNRLLYYSTREQLILQVEPGMIFIGYGGGKSVFESKYISTVLTPEEIQEISVFLDSLEESAEKEKMSKMLIKVYEAYQTALEV